MKLKTTVIVTLMAVVATTVFAGTKQDMSQCVITEAENMDIVVSSQEGEKLGYISLDPDNTWYVFIEGKGSLNENIVDEGSAIELICNSRNDTE